MQKTKHPNTYTLTKGLSENLIYAHRHTIPVVIIRPSTIVSAVAEPIPGWVENITVGVVGVIAGCMSGLLRTMYYTEHNKVRMTPIDFIANATIVSIYKKSTVPREEALYFNCTDVEGNQMNAHKGGEIFMKHVNALVPHKQLAWYPNFKSTSNFYWHIFCLYFFQLLPAYVFDLALLCRGERRL